MTLIVSMSDSQAVVMASDRLVTLARPFTGTYLRDYDRSSNKLIILVMSDAVVVMGYTGSAFIGTTHTDDWIAETLAPGADLRGSGAAMWGFRRPNSLRFHQLCNRLRLGLAAAGAGQSTEIHIAGWRLKRRRLIPISIILRACSPLCATPEVRLRSRRLPGTISFGHVGASVSCAEIRAGFQSIARRPFDAEAGRDMLTNIIRAKAAGDRSVGPHVMSVVIPHPSHRLIEGRFSPLHAHCGYHTVGGVDVEQVIGFSPWVLTPTTFVAPTETSGSGFGTWQADGWTIHIEDALPHAPNLSNTHWSRRQIRLPRP